MSQLKNRSDVYLGQMRFYVEQSNLPPYFTPIMIMTDMFQKMKPRNSVGRLFSDHNLRYFTLNLKQITLLYSESQNFTQNSGTQLPLEELQNVYDIPLELIGPPSKGFSNFALTLQFRDRLMVLVAKTEQKFKCWLNHFEMLRFRDSGKSVVIRRRTEYMIQTQSQIPDILFQNGQFMIQTNNRIQQQDIEKRTQSLDSKRKLTKFILEESKQRKRSAKRRPSPLENRETPKALTVQVNTKCPEILQPMTTQIHRSIVGQKSYVQTPETITSQPVDNQVTMELIKNKIQQQTISTNIASSSKQVRGSPLKPQISESTHCSGQNNLKPKNKNIAQEILRQPQRLPSIKNMNNESVQSISGDDNNSTQKHIQNQPPYMFIKPIRLNSGRSNKRAKTTDNKESQRIESSGRMGSITRNIWSILDDDGNLLIRPRQIKANPSDSKFKQGKDRTSQQGSQSLLIEDEFDESDFFDRMLGRKPREQNAKVNQNLSVIGEKSEVLSKGFFLGSIAQNQSSQEFKLEESDVEAIKFNIFETPINESQKYLNQVETNQIRLQKNNSDLAVENLL